MHIVENPLGVRLGTAVSYTGTTTTFTVRKDPSMPSVCHRQWRVAAVAVCLAMLAGCTDAPTPSISPSTSSRVQGESIEGGPAYVLRQNDRLLLRSVCAGGFTAASVTVVAGHNGHGRMAGPPRRRRDAGHRVGVVRRPTDGVSRHRPQTHGHEHRHAHPVLLGDEPIVTRVEADRRHQWPARRHRAVVGWHRAPVRLRGQRVRQHAALR